MDACAYLRNSLKILTILDVWNLSTRAYKIFLIES